MFDDTQDPHDEGGLSIEDCKRIIMDLLKDGPLTKEELDAKFEIVADHYDEMIASSAMWLAWRREAVRFGVTDGELLLHLVES